MFADPRHRSRAFARLLFGACFALALLAIGGAAHLRHHLEDPTCDAGPGPESHACASCTGLHGGALADAALADLPARIVWQPVAPAAAPAHRARDIACDAAPRAPPLA